MSDPLLSEQLRYYRRRAAEYDLTAYGDLEVARRRVERLISQMHPEGDVLEIACGTGMWTEALARTARNVTASDAAPEALQLARDRVTRTNVVFDVADIFCWEPGRRFDTIFFSAWLSHVPAARFEQFWYKLSTLLAPAGRVLFVDEHVDEASKEAYVAGTDEMITRTLRDGSRFQIVKNFVDPDRLIERLADLGWSSQIHRDGSDWIIGEAHRMQT